MFKEIVQFVSEVKLNSYTAKGEEVCAANSRVAVRRSDGRDAFIDVSAFDALGEDVVAQFKEGDFAVVEGEIRNKRYRVGARRTNVSYLHILAIRPAGLDEIPAPSGEQYRAVGAGRQGGETDEGFDGNKI
jgi:single-stranded DNA-binding protein